MTIRRTRRVRSSAGRGPRKPPDERKDYLIQARVPRELDDKLKQDAKRQRLSVSHLIRNVLEDTYKLVDGVISDVDTIVQESVELTGRMRRDAREIARSAVRVREAHEQERSARGAGAGAGAAKTRETEDSAQRSEGREPRANTTKLRDARESERQHHERLPSVPNTSAAKQPEPAVQHAERDERGLEPSTSHAEQRTKPDAVRSFEERTADVYAWNPVVLNRPVHCVRCEATLNRGETGNLGLSQDPSSTPRWLCRDCLAAL
jgi:ribosomal protein L19E